MSGTAARFQANTIHPNAEARLRQPGAIRRYGGEPEKPAMARKPNYSFERNQRAKCKAAKKAERLQAKADKLAAKRENPEAAEPQAQPQEASE